MGVGKVPTLAAQNAARMGKPQRKSKSPPCRKERDKDGATAGSGAPGGRGRPPLHTRFDGGEHA